MRKLIIILSIYVYLIYCIANNIKIKDLEQDDVIKIEIKGEVIEDKVITCKIGDTINDVISNVELTNNSDLSAISLLEKVYDNQIIYIPKNINESKISINSASLYELSVLPGIGKSIAKRIIDYRTENGSFHSLEDLKYIQGIGEKKYEKLKSYICL